MLDNETLIKTQNRLLEMGIVITDILEKHNINYMLAFGTLLGAARHKGFIPWDDDFDLQIFDDDYDKAIKFLKEELPNNLFVEDEKSEPLYFHAWAHVKDLYSLTECELFPQDSFYCHKGISVDLYRIKKMPLFELDDFLYKENINYLNRRKQKGLIKEEEYKVRAKKATTTISTTSKEKETKRSILGFVSSYNNYYYEIEDVFPLSPIAFCEHYFMSPNNYDKILTSTYGNYMKLPPKEKQRNHYSKVIFINNPSDIKVI